ncbi:hypothetical protein IM793_07420 [Pedobacter sp. MR2016-19]|uniref:hypothetical protein n=1 Tax=Pedobacter sp. MR2016-19 TaxID=2780089 RepID=UPI0018750BAB|nr:hypothetical protein [Pedobacter sp. MR2016-19]MBE5318979.1 hypothetical protein [Pedobacter sp. MR2016-19]
MKNKKLEKKTLFVFKRNYFANLTKEQMRRINGGNRTNQLESAGNASTLPDCDKTQAKTVVSQ